MSLTALKKDLAAIKQRRANAFVFTHSDATAPARGNVNGAYALGEIRDAKLNWEPMLTSKSTTGKQKMVGADVTATFILMQTSDVEFAALDDLIAENDFGTTFKFSNNPCGVASALTTDGIILENCGVAHAGEVDLGGGESGITFTLTGFASNASLAGLGTAPGGDYAAGERKLSFDAC